MGVGGVGSGEEVRCTRDGVATGLTCVQCRTPICPQCLVRTPVGMKCADCGAKPGRRSGKGGLGSRARTLAPVAAAVLVAGAIFVPKMLAGGGQTESKRDILRGPDPQAAQYPSRFARLGQEARDGDLAFVVDDLSCGATQMQGSAGTRTALGRFCFLTIDARNTGRLPANLVEKLQTVLDAQQRRFEPDPNATAAHPANADVDLTSLVVNPGNQVHGVLVYDVPPDVTPTYASLRAGPNGPGALVALVKPS